MGLGEEEEEEALGTEEDAIETIDIIPSSSQRKVADDQDVRSWRWNVGSGVCAAHSRGVRASRVVIVGHYRQLDGEGSGGGGGGGGAGRGRKLWDQLHMLDQRLPRGEAPAHRQERRAEPSGSRLLSLEELPSGEGVELLVEEEGVGEGGAGRIGEKVKLSIHSDQAVMSRGGNYSFALPGSVQLEIAPPKAYGLEGVGAL